MRRIFKFILEWNHIMVSISCNEDKIVVVSPKNAENVARFKELGGVWINRSWSFNFDRNIYKALKFYINGYYKCDFDSPKIKVKLIFTENKEQVLEPVSFYGFSFAIAYGKKTGSRVGAGVKLLDGIITSGGSIYNWSSYVEKGSQFLIEEFPSVFEPVEGIEIEVITPLNTQILQNERLKDVSTDELMQELDFREKLFNL